MFDNVKAGFASLFGDLAAAQKQIDDSARKIAEGVARMIDIVDDEVPSSRDALTGRDFSWYEGVARALVAEGFVPPRGFEPRAWLTRPVESRTLIEYALGDGGTVVAFWYALPATATRAQIPVITLFTACEDGVTLDTSAGGSMSLLPQQPTDIDERLPEDTSVFDLVARHRARVTAHGAEARCFDTIDAYLANRVERKKGDVEFWKGQGLGLVERYIEARFTGDSADVGKAYVASLRRHPEWYKYAAEASASAAAQEPTSTAGLRSSKPLTFLMSVGDDGRRTLTTLGMIFRALPELLMTGVAANHARAARVLVGTAARTIARERNAATDGVQFVASLTSPVGMRLTLTTADAIAAKVTRTPRSDDPRTIDVHVVMRGFTDTDEPSLLLIEPLPDDPRSADDRLREACAQLGVDVPVARDADSADDAMREAHERARERLADVRARWQARGASGDRVLVKIRATKGDVGEYVWLDVRDWRDGSLDGNVVTPAPRVDLAMGQSVTIGESQVYDQMVNGPSGATVLPLTDIVATDYGRDI